MTHVFPRKFTQWKRTGKKLTAKRERRQMSVSATEAYTYGGDKRPIESKIMDEAMSVAGNRSPCCLITADIIFNT